MFSDSLLHCVKTKKAQFVLLIYLGGRDDVPTSYRGSSEFPLQISDINTKRLTMLENQTLAIII